MSEIDIENEVMGHSHCEIGAYLLSLWGLPNPVVECAAYHHRPADCVDEAFVPLTAVHVATAIVDAGDSDELAGLDQDYIARLSVTESIPGWIEGSRAIGSDE